MMNDKHCLNIIGEDELAAQLGVRPRTIRLWRKFRGLPYIKLTGRKILYDPAAVQRWLARHEIGDGE